MDKIENSDKDHFKVIIPTNLSKTVSTYMLIKEDLIFVKNNAELLISCKRNENRNEQLEESLWYSLISIYGRCFTSAEHSKKPRLNKEDVFKGLKDTNITLLTHLKLFEIRNTFLAHRGDNENEYPIVYLKIPKNEELNETNNPFEIVTNRYSTETVDFLSNIIKLVDYLIPNVDIKLQKSSNKLYSKVVELDKDLLFKMTIK